MTVSCEQFETLMLDLAYEELGEEQSDALRTHAAQCAACRVSLEDIMLTRKLVSSPLSLEPAPSLDTPVLSAAADFAAQRAATEVRDGITAPPTPIVDEVTWLDRFRVLLLKPAFATAAVAAMVLVVTTFVVSKSPDRAAQPAEVEGTLDQSRYFEKRVERDKKTDEAPAVSVPKEDALVAQAEVASPASPVTREPAPARSSGPFNLGTSGPAPTPKMAYSKRSKSEIPVPEGAQPTRRSKPASGSGGALGTGSALDQDHGFLGEKKRTARIPENAEAEAPDIAAPADFERGMAAYRRGDCEAAKESLVLVLQSPATRGQKSIAIHHIARCEKRRGQCGRAISWYDKLLAGFYEYPDRGDALYEAAQCRRRLGHLSAARALLEELSRMPGQESRAREALDRLEGTKAIE